MTTDGKISRRNRDNFAQQIQMQLAEDPKTFFEYFFSFLKATSNFQYFKKTEESPSSSISAIIDCERSV